MKTTTFNISNPDKNGIDRFHWSLFTANLSSITFCVVIFLILNFSFLLCFSQGTNIHITQVASAGGYVLHLPLHAKNEYARSKQLFPTKNTNHVRIQQVGQIFLSPVAKPHLIKKRVRTFCRSKSEVQQTQQKEYKSSTSSSGLLDSTYIWYRDSVANALMISGKYLYTYDVSNNLISEQCQYFNGTGWDNIFQYFFTYDASNNPISELYQTWNGTNWVNTQQYFATYDASNNQTSWLWQTWSGTNWINNEQYLDTYDINNNWTSYLYQTWNGTGWDNISQYLFTYDASNNPISALDQTWNGTNWENNEQYFATYDASNNQTSWLWQTWNGTNWINNEQYFYTYDINNNWTSELYQTWNGTGWDNISQYLSTYDANNNWIIDMYQTWNGIGWDNNSQYFMTYDTYNNQTSYLYQIWTGSNWVNNDRDLYTYDTNNNWTSDLYQTWNGTGWDNTSQSFYTYDANNHWISDLYQTWNVNVNNWMNIDSTHYYYSNTAGILNFTTQGQQVVVYPNPTSGKFQLSISGNQSSVNTVEIYNVMGEVVYRTSNTKHRTPITIDLSSQPNATYFIVLNANGSKFSKSIIKQGK